MSKLRSLAVVLLAAAALAVPAVAGAASLSGRVSVAGDGPAASVWLIVAQGSGEVKRSQTGDDGRYYLNGLTAGRYEVTVERRGETVHRAEVSLPAADSRVTLDIRLP